MNIVDLPIEEGMPEPTRCAVCQQTLRAGTACRECVSKLLDLAWFEGSESPFHVVDVMDGSEGPEAAYVRLNYDHYEICRTTEGKPWELGRGAMGITYKAIDQHLGCPVALKIIGPRVFAGLRSKDRFLREARTAAGLRHPNIASIHHLGLGEEGCYYAMEYIDGETLDAHIQRVGPLPYRTALNIVLQAARALRTAHNRAFIHQDIKPTNLMLVNSEVSFTAESVVKVIDFGLVKNIDDENSASICHGYFAGTPQYASPEQLSCGTVDARSDIYSLGACLQYMLTGQRPVATMPDDAEDEKPRPDRNLQSSRLFPNRLTRLLRSMIASDPTLRPQSAGEVIDGISRYLQQDSNWVTRGRSSVWMMFVLLAILVATAASGSLWHLHELPSDTSKLPMKSTVNTLPCLEARVLYVQGNEHRFRLTKQENLQAIACYSKAIDLCPDFADAHAALASAYLQNVCRFDGPPSQRDDAIACAQRAIALDPNSPAGFTALGEIRTVQGLHWVALAQYHRALELNPEFPPAMRGFSLLWSTVGQPQRGLVWAKAAVKIDPAQAVGWNAAASACVELCADEQAELFYRRCLEINPVWIPAHCGLVHLHLLQGRFDQARQDYLMLESIDSNLLLPLTLKAQIALFGGKYSEAESIYRRLLTIKRDGFVHYFSSISYLSALGYLRCRAGDRLEGERFLDAAATLHLEDSEGPQAIYDLAAIRSIQGKMDEALGLLKQAISSGWIDYRATQLDPRFEALRGQVAFRRMLEDLKGHVEQMSSASACLCAKPLTIADYTVKPPSD